MDPCWHSSEVSKALMDFRPRGAALGWSTQNGAGEAGHGGRDPPRWSGFVWGLE